MEVKKCSEQQGLTNPRTYSFDELQTTAPEGVYRHVAYPADDTLRFVVLADGGFRRKRAVLYSKFRRLELATEECWCENRFVPTDETVCFEIR
jgi:hypothetical protein